MVRSGSLLIFRSLHRDLRDVQRAFSGNHSVQDLVCLYVPVPVAIAPRAKALRHKAVTRGLGIFFAALSCAGVGLRAQSITSVPIITTVAGDGTAGFGGDNGPATSAAIYEPCGVAIDGMRNIYIADTSNNRIRKVNAASGIITTVAGDGVEGFSGDDGPATGAELDGPCGVAVDSLGNLYIADTYNNRIRKVTASTGTSVTVPVPANGAKVYATLVYHLNGIEYLMPYTYTEP